MTEYECEECKTRTKLTRRLEEDETVNCENIRCGRFGEPMRELV